MCGVPVHATDGYLARLIKAGHRVAIAEQIETPEQAKKRGGSKALVARAIVRVVTAGTLTEEALLDSRTANWCAAIGEAGGEVAIAAPTSRPAGSRSIECDAERARAPNSRGSTPAETIASEASAFAELATHAAPARAISTAARGEARLKALFGVATLDGFGQFSRAALAAAGGLVAYLEHTAKGALPFLRPPRVSRTDACMAIDAATRESLELDADRRRARARAACSTRSTAPSPARGARLLGRRYRRAADGPRARSRRGSIWSSASTTIRRCATTLRATLRALPDIGRALGRLAAGRGSPRDLGQLRDGLDGAWRLGERLGAHRRHRPRCSPSCARSCAAMAR